MMQGKEEDAVLKFKERFKEPSLSINSVPQPSLDFFLSFSREEFDGHRGMALKWLIDFYHGVMPSKEDLIAEIDALRQEVRRIEEKTAERPKQTNVRRTVSGKPLGRK